MLNVVNIYETMAQLSRVIDCAARRVDIVFARAGQSVRLVPTLRP